MSMLTTSILQKVRDELQAPNDASSTELYDLLHRYRNTQHPDKYLDNNLKAKAEEKFKKLNNLIYELGKFIEQEKQQKSPSELIFYQKDYEIVKSKQQNINYEKEIEDLKITIEVNGYTIRDLKKEILLYQRKEVDKKSLELVKQYKPTKRSLYSLGITFFLTFIIGILTKINEVAQIIAKYFPFEPQILNYIVFGILIGIPLYFCRKVFEENRINSTAKRIKTPFFINRFVLYLEEMNIQDGFNEMNVYKFLSIELIPKNLVLKLWYSKFHEILSDTTIASLKDIFIYNLLSKQLITISSAEKLDRYFNIIKTKYRSSDIIDFDDL